LDYTAGDPGDPPVLAVRVQELFGLTETPTVAGGRVPITLHLLSPAGRPVQITSDLAGFWSGSWHDVRREKAERTQHHAWPADPTAPYAAPAGPRVERRGRRSALRGRARDPRVHRPPDRDRRPVADLHEGGDRRAGHRPRVLPGVRLPGGGA